MSQITRLVPTPGPGSGSVTSVSGGNNITITGDPTVNPTVNVSGTTNHAVQVGNATGSLTSIPVGLTGQVLTGVTGGDPVFAAPPASGVTSITGNTGAAQTGAINLVTANSTPIFAGSGGTITLDFDLTSNLLLGANAVSLAGGTDNVGYGRNAGEALTTGLNNTFIGSFAGFQHTTGNNSTAVGSFALAGALAGAGGNTALGSLALQSVTTGDFNIGLGFNAGGLYNGTESFNICIGNEGTIGESSVIRIGNSVQHASTYIAGIDGVNVGSTAKVVTMGTAGTADQLGTATITAGTGITVTPGANTITIDATGGGVTSITGTTGGAQAGAITLSGGTTGLAYGGAAGTITSTFAGITANGGTVNLGTDNTTNAITIGTGTGGRTINIGLSAANNLLFLGTANGSAATNIQAGSGSLVLNSTGGTASLDATSGVSINSTAGALSLGTGANNFAVDIGTAGTRTVTLGSTTSTSSTAIRSGTGNVAINTGLTVDSTGRNTNAVQPMFIASQTGNQTNVTGDGTVYTVTFTNEIVDQNNNFDATSTFTAPITGNYLFCVGLQVQGLTAAMTNDLIFVVTTAATYRLVQGNFFATSITGLINWSGSVIANMTVGDTAIVRIQCNGGTKVVTIPGSTATGFRSPYFSGTLLC